MSQSNSEKQIYVDYILFFAWFLYFILVSCHANLSMLKEIVEASEEHSFPPAIDQLPPY